MTCKEKTHEELFDQFISESREKLANYIANLPENDFKGLSDGYYEVAVAVMEADTTLSLIELRNGLLEIARTSQSAFVDSQTLYQSAKPVNHAIEHVYPANVDKVAHNFYTEYFRYHTDGFLFYAGHYNFDNRMEKPSLYFGWPIVCIGKALIFASAASKLWVEKPEFLFGCRFTGLSGRQLTDGRYGRFIYHGHDVCVSSDVTLSTLTLSPDQIESCLVDTLHELLIPLYEHFDYLQLGRDLVAHIVAPEEVTAN